MSEIKPKMKTISYDYMGAIVDYRNGTLTLTITETGESIVIPRAAYGELVAIMSDIGHQVPVKTEGYKR